MNQQFNIFSKAVFAFVAMISIVSYADETPLPKKYQQIIDRCMFGPNPSDPAAFPEKGSESSKNGVRDERELTKEQERLEKTVYVSALSRSGDGSVVKVGFSDSSEGKKVSHYFLAVGESKDGWLVVSADIETKKVVLKKDDIEIERVFGDKNGSSSAAQDSRQMASAGSQPSAERSPLLGRTDSNRGALLGGNGLLSRRMLRHQKEEANRVAAQQRDEQIRNKAIEEERKRAEEANAIRQEQDSAERAEHRQRLMDMQEELRKIREAREQNSESNTQN